MSIDPQHPRSRPGDPSNHRGLPDEFLIGLLVVLLAIPSVVWLAAGVSGWIAHGRWPAISFTQSVGAMRGLVAHPHEVALAWPAAVRGGLASTTEFWVTIVLMVMVVGALILGVAVWVYRRRVRRYAEERAVVDFMARRGP